MLLSVVHVVFFGRAPYIKETLSDFLINYGSRSRGHNSVVSGYLTYTSFPWVDGWSMDPWVLGRHR